MTIELQQNSSDINVLSKIVTTLSSVNGTLKNATSIIRPTIQIEGTLPTNCNYFTIPDFGRSYFIDDVTSIHNNIFEISGHVDVLYTYAAQIRACSGIIARQQNKWNLYIDDGTFKTYQNELITIKKFPSGFQTQEFVLAVAGS